MVLPEDNIHSPDRGPSAAPVSYGDLTVNDRNPLKRALQRSRLRHGLRALAQLDADFDGALLDLGAGNGELAKLLAARFPRGHIVCYEPTPTYRREAEENLSGVPGARVVGELAGLREHSFDVVFCLEVLEHLPPRETRSLLADTQRLLKPDGLFVVGVPNEIYLAAFVRGMFRYVRRYGDFDTQPGNILRAVIGRPPVERPLHEVNPGYQYHRRHMGFDHRKLRQVLALHFDLVDTYGSPFTWISVGLNFEVYFVCRPMSHQSAAQAQAL